MLAPIHPTKDNHSTPPVNVMKGLAGVRHPTCYDELQSPGTEPESTRLDGLRKLGQSCIRRVSKINLLTR